MIRLVLEEDGARNPLWRLRVKGTCVPFAGFRPGDWYETKEAAEAELVSHGGSWLAWMEAYEVEGTGVGRTEVMSWPAREDFDAWAAKVKSGIKARKRRKRMAKGPATAGPTSAPFAAATISEAEANALDSNAEYQAQLRRIIREAFARQTGKKAGMYWEEKDVKT